MIQRYFRPTKEDLKAEQEYWGYYPNNTSLPHFGQRQSLFSYNYEILAIVIYEIRLLYNVALRHNRI